MMFIAAVPTGFALDSLAEIDGAQAFCKRLNLEFTEVAGTIEFDGRRLVLGYADCDCSHLELVTSEETRNENGDLESIYINWQILANCGEQVDQSLLLPYFARQPVIDESGEVVGYDLVTDLTGKLQTWAGKQWLY